MWEEPGFTRVTHQVLIGQPRDLVLEAGLHLRLLGQQEALGQQLLLPPALLLHPEELPAHLLDLLLVGAALVLKHALQDPGGGEQLAVSIYAKQIAQETTGGREAASGGNHRVPHDIESSAIQIILDRAIL